MFRVALVLALAACAADDTAVDTDIDTSLPDTDTDSDTEADTDLDTTPGTNRFVGTEYYRLEVQGYDEAGDPWSGGCETTWPVTGGELEGDCPLCDWAFVLQRGEMAGDCLQPDPERQLYPSGEGLLSHVVRFGDDEGFDYLAVGPVDDVDDYTDSMLYSRGAFGFQRFTQDGTGLDLSSSRSVSTVVTAPRYVYSNDCSPPDVVRGDAPVTGTAIQGTLPCGSWQIDSYTFSATVGDVIEFSVDTTVEGSGFQPNIILNAPDGCASSLFAYAFACTAAPEDADCPAGTITITQTGTWELLVVEEGYCEASVVDYTLTAAGTTLTPMDDDVPEYGSIRVERLTTGLQGTFRFAPGP